MDSKLKKMIEHRGLKKTFVAEKLGVSKQALNAWINGNSIPTLETAFKIAEFFDCTVYDIWETKKEKGNENES